MRFVDPRIFGVDEPHLPVFLVLLSPERTPFSSQCIGLNWDHLSNNVFTFSERVQVRDS